MEIREENKVIKGGPANLMINAQKTPEQKVAEQINELPPTTRMKLLLAEDQAQKQGDHRSILDPNKYFTLLMQVDPTFLDTLQQQVQTLMKNTPNLQQAVAAASNNPEKLADMILTLCGISDRGDFLGGELQAKYPKMNKSSLVKLGAKTLYAMIMNYLHTLNNITDNRTAIAKFDRFMSEIVVVGPEQNSNLQPPK